MGNHVAHKGISMSKQSQNPTLSRRDFLRLGGVLAGSLIVSGCKPEQAASTATQIPSPSNPAVAIGQARTYEREAIESQVRALIDQLRGLGDVVRPGDSEAIKPNLTGGGTSSARVPGFSPEESFVTH